MDVGGEDEETKVGSEGGGQQGQVAGGEEEEGADVHVKAVPASVYGNLASMVGDKRGEEGEGQGAMERLKKRRVQQ